MSGTAERLKSDGPSRKPMSEARIWTLALAVAAMSAAVAGLGDLLEGMGLFTSAPSRIGAGLGLLLAWGGFHHFSRRSNEVGLLVGLAGTATILGRPAYGFSGAFVRAFLVCAFSLPIGAIVSRRLLQWIGPLPSSGRTNASKPQSGHLLYDAEIDGATGSAVPIEKSGRG